jgi:hypothetical protein
MKGRPVRIALLAVLGLLLAAGLGAAASRITSEQVGLYGEPPSVGSELVSEPDRNGQRRPARADRRRDEGGNGGSNGKGSVTTEAVPATPIPAPAPLPEPAPITDDSSTESEPESEEEYDPPEHESEDSDDD